MSLELSILRNKLKASHFSEKEEFLLSSIEASVDDWGSAFSDLIIFCLNNIKEDILNGSFEVASAEAQLIHNLPTNVMEVSNWNERHFFLYEIRSYLNKVKDFSRVRTVIVLAGRIGAYMDTTNKANK